MERVAPSPGAASGDRPFRRKALTLSLFLILAGSVLNALFGDGGLIDLMKARRELRALEQEIASLEADNRRLLQEVRDLKTSPMAVERIAREELNLVKPNELILLIQSPQNR